MRNYIVPHYVDREGGKTHTYDIYSRLLKDRIIVLNGEVRDDMAASITSQLLILDNESDKDISIYITSPGGSVYSGLAIYDTMRSLRCNVNTVVIGYAASMGAVLLSGGTKGKRYALKNATTMIHTVRGGARGAIDDMEIDIQEARRLNNLLTNELAENCGMSPSKMKRLMERDKWLSATDALEINIIDKIINKIGEV